MPTTPKAKLALDGGAKACHTPWPERHLFGVEEKQAAAALFDQAIATGQTFGYNGPEEDAYSKEFAEYLGGGYADGVNSGTNAVWVALRALEIKAFSEVICPPITDPGGVMPVALCNCIPIPADAAPGSFNTGPEQIAARINDRTGAILVAHIAGIPVEMTPVMEIARAKGIPVIEDCAQAHGAKYRNQYVGTFGDIAAFSTMFGKHHATGGQGGLVFTKNEMLYWRARRHADRGKPFNLAAGTSNVVCALNCNLNELSAAIGRAQLQKLPGIVKARQLSARKLSDACQRELKTVRIVNGPAGAESACWFLFAQLDLAQLNVDKATFAKALQAEGVVCSADYVPPFTAYDWYRNRAVFPGTQYPWTCPLYKGDPNRDYPLPNIAATAQYTFVIYWHEGVGDIQVQELFQALKKVEAAYRK